MRNITLSILVALLSSLFLAGCASSRKTATSVSSSVADSTSLSLADSVKASIVRNEKTETALTDSLRFSSEANEQGTNEETITEQITEQIDAVGNKTTTINRTTTRKGDYTKQTNMDAIRVYREQATKQYVDSLNAALSSRLNAYKKYFASQDSINNIQEKNTSEIKTSTGWARAKTIVMVILILFVLAWCIQHNLHKN